MNIELMIDTLNVITDKSQGSIEQLIRKNKTITEKLQFVSLCLNEMKTEVYEWIINILNSSNDIRLLTKKLSELKTKTSEQLTKHRLHILLKRKLNKLKKQSFLHSIDSQNSIIGQDQESKIQDLQRSVMIIEKDLKIQHQDDDVNLGLSQIIQRSRLNLDYNNDLNISTVSEYSEVNFKMSPINNSQNLVTQSKTNIQEKLTSKNYSQANYDISTSTKQNERFIQIEGVFSQNLYSSSTVEKLKENKVNNFVGSEKQDSDKHFGSSKLNDNYMPKKQNDSMMVETSAVGVQKAMKKKKKSVFTSAGLNKEGLLGNLLEQSYQSCLSTSNSS